MGVPYGKFEVEALSYEELEIKNVGSGCSRDVGGVRLERYRVVRCLGRQEQSCQPGCGGLVRDGKNNRRRTYMTFLGCQSMTVFLR